MKNRKWIHTLGALLCTIPFATQAIDRDADMIDSFVVGVQELDEMDGYSLNIHGETALKTPGQKWAVLAGAGMGEVSPDDVDENVSFWKFQLGMRYYVLPLTAISAIGHYEVYDINDDMDVKAGEVGIRQRFAPASNPISPFLSASVTFRDRSTFSDINTSADSISEYLLTLGGGCEFHMGEKFAWVMQGAYVAADASDDDAEELDGIIASVALTYYFITDK